MDAPRYTLTVTNLSRGWSYTTVHQDPVPEIPAGTRSFLASPAKIEWGFESEVIPNPLAPSRATINIWARTASDVPLTDLGDLIEIDLRLGDGTPLIRLPQVRVAAAEINLVPTSQWAARLTFTGSDLLLDLGSCFPQLPADEPAHPYSSSWRKRWAVIGAAVGASIGVAAGNAAGDPNGSTMMMSRVWAGDAGDTLTRRLLASNTGSDHLVLVPYRSAGYPAGYEYAGAGLMADPNSVGRYLVTALRTTITGPRMLPLSFTVIKGQLTITNNASTIGVWRGASVDARYCTTPTKARRSRAHVTNTVRLKGVRRDQGTLGSNIDDDTYSEFEYQHSNAADVAQRGVVGRSIDTMLVLRDYMNFPDPGVPAWVPTKAAAYLAGPAARNAAYTFDEFEILAHEMPLEVARGVLPNLAPSVPGDGRDGEILRDVAIHGAATNVDVPGAALRGFITTGMVEINRGELTYRLTLAPGERTFTGAEPIPITVGEFTAAAVSTTTVANTDPSPNVADLSLVDA